jgi:hypothetical protein
MVMCVFLHLNFDMAPISRPQVDPDDELGTFPEQPSLGALFRSTKMGDGSTTIEGIWNPYNDRGGRSAFVRTAGRRWTEGPDRAWRERYPGLPI